MHRKDLPILFHCWYFLLFVSLYFLLIGNVNFLVMFLLNWGSNNILTSKTKVFELLIFILAFLQLSEMIDFGF